MASGAGSFEQEADQQQTNTWKVAPEGQVPWRITPGSPEETWAGPRGWWGRVEGVQIPGEREVGNGRGGQGHSWFGVCCDKREPWMGCRWESSWG